MEKLKIIDAHLHFADERYFDEIAIEAGHKNKKIMFGTDWPLANLKDYIDFTKAFIPQEEWEQVFYKSAKNIYHLQ